MYQGHRNRVHWNVAYYLFNDYELYSMVKNEVKQAKNLDIAAKNIFKRVPEKTPDGYKYSLSAIRAALVRIKDRM